MESLTPNTSMNKVELNVGSNSSTRNHKHNFSLNVVSLHGPHKMNSKLQLRIDQMKLLNSHELLGTGVWDFYFFSISLSKCPSRLELG